MHGGFAVGGGAGIGFRDELIWNCVTPSKGHDAVFWDLDVSEVIGGS